MRDGSDGGERGDLVAEGRGDCDDRGRDGSDGGERGDLAAEGDCDGGGRKDSAGWGRDGSADERRRGSEGVVRGDSSGRGSSVGVGRCPVVSSPRSSVGSSTSSIVVICRGSSLASLHSVSMSPFQSGDSSPSRTTFSGTELREPTFAPSLVSDIPFCDMSRAKSSSVLMSLRMELGQPHCSGSIKL